MIYLDHHAATPLGPRVRSAMAEAHEHAWSNPESAHQLGRAARAVRERVRAQVAESLGAKPADVVLAGSGTEALHLALVGLARARRAGGSRGIVISDVEHPAVRGAAELLEREGMQVRRLPVRAGRAFSARELAGALREETACVAIQWVNHETGTVLPVADYAGVCRAHGVPLVVDACQALGKLPLNVTELDATAVVVAAAKIGGPAGVSALWHERCVELEPLFQGGGQERGFRPGTPDIAAIAGFGAALSALPERLAATRRIARLRDRLEQAGKELGAVVNGAEGERVATVTNLSFPGWRADVLTAALDIEGLCASAGAACSSGVGTPSPVLSALYPEESWRSEAGLRLSLGPETTEQEVDEAMAILRRVVGRMRRT